VSLVARVTALAQAIATDIKSLMSGKVDKVSGKGLSTEDYSAGEKSKLAGIASGAQVNSVTSVAGRTGAVTLTKSDVGLANADNTADSAKPVSVAQQAALDAKLDLNNPQGLNNLTMRTFSPSQSTSLSVERSRGTPSAPLPTLNNDKLGAFSFQSLDSAGNIYQNVVLEAFSRVDQSPTDRGALFQFATVKKGESTRSVALQIDDGGKISMPNGFYAGMPSRLAPYTLSTLPTASGWTNFLIIVTNATGGPKVCYSNGANWLILNTTTPVS
jgi:hypothetical protein